MNGTVGVCLVVAARETRYVEKLLANSEKGMTMADREPRKLPYGRTITLPGQTYQPPKAEREKEHDMPGVSMKTARRAFFRPVNVRRESQDRS